MILSQQFDANSRMFLLGYQSILEGIPRVIEANHNTKVGRQKNQHVRVARHGFGGDGGGENRVFGLDIVLSDECFEYRMLPFVVSEKSLNHGSTLIFLLICIERFRELICVVVHPDFLLLVRRPYPF